MIGKLLPRLCKIAKVPVLTNHSIRTSSIRAMRRGGYDRNQVAMVSGHKDPKNLQNYDALTVLDKTKIALAMQQGPATLDGEQINLDALARGEKRKVNEELGEGTSKMGQGTSKRQNNENVTQEEVIHHFVVCNDDSGLGGEQIVLSQNDVNEMPAFNDSDNVANPKPADSQPDSTERAIPSSQAHNVAGLIRDHMSASKELINNYLSALKK